MMFGFGSFNLINEFERASNKPNAEQLASSSARLQPYLHDLSCLHTSHYITLIICNYFDFCYWGPEKESCVRKSKSQMARISSILIIFKENAWQYHGVRHNF